MAVSIITSSPHLLCKLDQPGGLQSPSGAQHQPAPSVSVPQVSARRLSAHREEPDGDDMDVRELSAYVGDRHEVPAAGRASARP